MHRVINSFQNKIVTIQHANQSIIILTQCALHQLVHTLTGCTFMYFKIVLECFILTNETKIPLNGLVLGACYNTCLWHSWNLFSTCKHLSDLFWKHCSFIYTLILRYIKLSIVDISCKIREYISSLLISIDLTKLSLPTNHRFCIGTLTYNALLPVQRFFFPFWTRRRKFQRTTTDAIIRNMNVSVWLNSGTTII